MRNVVARLRGRLGGGVSGPNPYPWTQLDLRHVLSSGLRLRVRSESDWWVYNEIFVDGVYDRAIELALANAPADETFRCVDLGANVGFFAARTVQLAHRVGIDDVEVVLVEGSPSVASELRERVAEWPEHIKTKVVHGLVGDRTGSDRIGEVQFSARNSLSLSHNSGILPPDQIPLHEVAFVDLCSILADVDRVHLLKCDVEGAEQRVLQTYRFDVLPKVAVAVIELHRLLVDVDACSSALRDGGLEEVAVLETTEETSLVLLARPEATT